MSISLEKLCAIINENFSEPFLVKNGVSAEIINDEGTKILNINIGRRDVQINETGEVIGCGTFMGMSNDTLIFNDE